MANDVERDALEVVYVKGYPSLAAFIASDQDKSTAIYRRFDRLSARNLLYLQSELQELEARQDALDAEDLHGDLQAKKSARNWQVLKKRAKQQNNEREKERLELAFEIRDKLKEYSAYDVEDLVSRQILTQEQEKRSSSSRRFCPCAGPLNGPSRPSTTSSTMSTALQSPFQHWAVPVRRFLMTGMTSWRSTDLQRRID
jgi:hypothetical protein